tara:strand:+ start:329 stop:1435 length:1107 start_codon:yes stop_codon:yes gene_type:complete
MSTKVKWIVPCYFNTDNLDNEIEFDLTHCTKKIIENEVWNRDFEYGNRGILKDVDPKDIINANAKILPRFTSGYVNEKRIIEYVSVHCNKIHSYFKTENYKDWYYSLGVVVIEIDLNYKSKTVPSKKQVQDFNFDSDFLRTYHIHVALLKEVSSVFLASLHLTYPTRSIMSWNDSPVNDGIFYIASGRKKYITKLNTDSFMHHILINKNRLDDVQVNINGLSSVWHLNLWSLKRLLISVKSNLISMDNLLDLIYALEGLFEEKASSDFIKMFTIVSLSNDKKEARKVKEILDKAFKIRNEIAHGSSSFDGYEKIKISGKEILSQDIYWEMKVIVIRMVINAINKLKETKGMKNLNFKSDDLFNLIYKK